MRHLVGAGVIMTVADASTTWLAVQVAAASADVSFTELNPIFVGLIATHGPAGALTLKVIIGLAVFGYLGWAARRSRWGANPLVAAVLLTSAVVVWNVRMLATVMA